MLTITNIYIYIYIYGNKENAIRLIVCKKFRCHLRVFRLEQLNNSLNLLFMDFAKQTGWKDKLYSCYGFLGGHLEDLLA